MTKPLLHLHSVKRKGAVRVRSLFSLGEEPLSPCGTGVASQPPGGTCMHASASLLAWRSHLHCKDGGSRSRHIHGLAVAVGVGPGLDAFFFFAK
jgi:hypothetical protein